MKRAFFILGIILILSTSLLSNEINWLPFPEALDSVNGSNKHTLVLFYSPRCGWCKKLFATTFADSEIISYINDEFFASKINIVSDEPILWEEDTISERAIATAFGISGVPAFVFIDSKSKYVMKLSGYKDKLAFKTILDYISKDWYEDLTLDEYIESEITLKKQEAK